MCFQCTILVHKTYELWVNDICTICITKLWDAKFVMYYEAYINLVQYQVFY